MSKKYILNKGITKTAFINNKNCKNRIVKNKIAWNANYDGKYANLSVDIDNNGKKKHMDMTFDNNDLSKLLSLPSENKPLDKRLLTDFENDNLYNQRHLSNMYNEPNIMLLPIKPKSSILDKSLIMPLSIKKSIKNHKSLKSKSLKNKSLKSKSLKSKSLKSKSLKK